MNELSKSAKDVGTEKWESIAQHFVPNLAKMSARNLTMLVNALSHARVRQEIWFSEALTALDMVPKKGYSAQDLCVLLSSMVRLSCHDGSFVQRLLEEECPRRVLELEPRGIAGFAHAVTRLGGTGAESLVQALLPKMRSFLSEGVLLPLEMALAIDALSRFGDGGEPLVHGTSQLPRWADEATSDLEDGLCAQKGVSRLKPLEVVMVISALSRRGFVGADLAAALSSAVAAHLAKWPPEELCIVVHSAARLDLRLDLPLVDGGKAPLMSILDVVSDSKDGHFLKECSPDHLALLLHGLAKLLVQPPTALWKFVLETRITRITSPGSSVHHLLRPTAIRLSLAAAKADFKHELLRDVLQHAIFAGPLESLSDDAFAAIVYALMHPFYCRRRFLLELLMHVASFRHVGTQSLALQIRLGLVHFMFCTNSSRMPSSTQIHLLSKVEVKTSEKAEWSRSLRSRPSALQSDVHFQLNAITGSATEAAVGSEVLLWPFCVDLLWPRVENAS